jgi:phage/conjugal plasmid C-4 type zinc finger TraR family protein
MDEMDFAQEAHQQWLADCLETQKRVSAAHNQRTTNEAVICIDCDEPIPARRLAVQPNAERCVQCQSDFETGGTCDA